MLWLAVSYPQLVAAGRGGPLPLYLMKKAAREQFTVHFTCRLQKPEVAHSSLRALTGQ